VDSKRNTERLDASQKSDVTRAATILRSGGTVAFPTETVYGLGANALSAEAVEQIFVAKQRPHWDPLIVHVCDMDMLAQVAVTPLHPTARKLIEKFWPGPLTLLLPRTSAIPDSVTAGRPLVGVRMPAHPVALQLIREAGVPIAAPSANTFGHTSPTAAAHVLADLDGRIDAILDGGPTTVGLESTVAEIDDLGILIYRPGGIGLDTLASLNDAGRVRLHTAKAHDVPPESLPSPGVGIRHYAPRARLVLVEVTAKSMARRGTAIDQALIDAVDKATTETSRLAVMLPEGWNPSSADLTYPWGPWHDLDILAQRLYSGLRALDDAGATIIICPIPELPGIGDAIRDRLQKAAR
jgi:L-threonylcarbamoyladenylate synthase